MNLTRIEEPKSLKSFMEALKTEHATDPRVDWDSFVVWAGNQLPKYLWSKWKDELKADGFTWQSFLKILRLRTDIVLKWFNGHLLWNEFVVQTIELLKSPLAKQMNERLEKNKSARGAVIRDFMVKVPIYGMANAGSPTLVAEQNFEGYLPVSKRIIGSRKVFAVKVSGDSMNLATIHGKAIESGDYVVLDGDRQFSEGDKVLAVIEGLATIKVFGRKGEQIKLMPLSMNMKHRPIYLSEGDDFVINGKIVDVIKKK